VFKRFGEAIGWAALRVASPDVDMTSCHSILDEEISYFKPSGPVLASFLCRK
jgi:hypothetical protein